MKSHIIIDTTWNPLTRRHEARAFFSVEAPSVEVATQAAQKHFSVQRERQARRQ